ncbi:MAG: universal stress protein [Cyclobacteriaceae bacterium]
MERFKKMLVCLDQSSLDLDIIKATGVLCELMPREVTFINVIRDFSLPEGMMKEFPDLLDTALKERKEEIRKSLQEHFTWPDVDVKIKVVQGAPSKAILKYANKSDFDLIVAGRRESGSGVIRSRLARKSDCSFLLIAEGAKLDLNHILVPIDFSEHSKMALSKAVDFARLVPNLVTIFAQNVYTVPTGYHYTGKSREEFADVMKENAQKDYEAFMRTVDTDGKEVNAIFSHNDNDDFVSDIRDQAKNLKAELIIIGAKGQTSTSALFIGSRAERIVMMDTDSSMLMVRKKGEKAGFMDFIDEL